MTSIIILVQNRYDFVKRCIESILTHTRSPFEFVFIMQAVTDPRIWTLINGLTVEKIIVINDINNGVTPGRNQGIDAATGEYLLFFDDDAYVDENLAELKNQPSDLDWIMRMHQYFGDPNVGIVAQSGSYINPNQPGMFWVLSNSIGCQCDVGQGYCFMFSREVVHKIGRLDPFFGKFWHEESEYALRAKYSGFKVVNAGYIGVYHEGSGSGDDGTFGSKIDYMFQKWSPHFDRILEFPRWENRGQPIRVY